MEQHRQIVGSGTGAFGGEQQIASSGRPGLRRAKSPILHCATDPARPQLSVDGASSCGDVARWCSRGCWCAGIRLAWNARGSLGVRLLAGIAMVAAAAAFVARIVTSRRQEHEADDLAGDWGRPLMANTAA